MAHIIKQQNNFKNLSSNWVRVFHMGSPLFCLGTHLCLHLVGFVWVHAGEVVSR